jgi:hypothetical protein
MNNAFFLKAGISSFQENPGGYTVVHYISEVRFCTVFDGYTWMIQVYNPRLGLPFWYTADEFGELSRIANN